MALVGTVLQSSTYSYYTTASYAIYGPINNNWNGGCSSTKANHLTAWWGLKLPELVYVTNIDIYYRQGSKYQ